MKLLFLFCFASLEGLVFTETRCHEELVQIRQELRELEKALERADASNGQDDCACDCKMVGLPGEPGFPGKKGQNGKPGIRGPNGETGLPGSSGNSAPIGPLPEEDPAFLHRVRLRWKGYNGPWGQFGQMGQKGERAICDCKDWSEKCMDWCSPVKGDRGVRGLPGVRGDTGDFPDDAEEEPELNGKEEPEPELDGKEEP